MELMEGLLTRRSVRKYQDKPIERETMMEIIKAAQYSPTAHNRQPWEFLVIDDREFLAELRHIQRWTSFAKDAACVVIVCGDTEKSFSRSKEDEKWTFIDVDCAIATENLMLAAWARRMRQLLLRRRADAKSGRRLKRASSSPRQYPSVCHRAMGYPAETPKQPEDRYHRKRYTGANGKNPYEKSGRAGFFSFFPKFAPHRKNCLKKTQSVIH